MPSREESHRVRFLPRTQITLIPTLDEMSEEEIAAVWRNEYEDRQTQHGLVKTIRTMRGGEAGRHVKDGENISTRGLEYLRSTARMEQHIKNRDSVKDAVLQEQERQWSKSIEDTEKIASSSARASQWALECALSLAKEDAAFVRRSIRKSLRECSKGKYMYQYMFAAARNVKGDLRLPSTTCMSEPAFKSCLKNRSVDNSSDQVSLRSQAAKTNSEVNPTDLQAVLGQVVAISTEGE